jgi:hypothetical protein
MNPASLRVGVFLFPGCYYAIGPKLGWRPVATRLTRSSPNLATMPSILRPLLHTPVMAVLLAATFGAHAQATVYKMRIPVGPIAAAAPAPVPGISIPGYDPVTGTFQSAQGSFTWNGTSYSIPSGTAFGHTGPVALTPAVTAAAAKAAMRDNHGSLAGTLAEGWLTGQGIAYSTWNYSSCTASTCSGTLDATYACLVAKWGSIGAITITPMPAGETYYQAQIYAGTWNPANIYCSGPSPADQADWDALPDPLPAVAPELPYAPYLPAGAAVQNNFQITDLDTGTVHNCTNGGCD